VTNRHFAVAATLQRKRQSELSKSASIVENTTGPVATPARMADSAYRLGQMARFVGTTEIHVGDGLSQEEQADNNKGRKVHHVDDDDCFSV